MLYILWVLFIIALVQHQQVVVLTSAPGNEAELQLYRVMQRASLLANYDSLLEMGASSTSNKAAVRQPNAEFNVTCNSKNNTPIDACGVRVWVENEKGENPPTPPLDFNNGNQSSQQTRRSDNNDVLFKGKYSGLGLESGECGVTLFELREGRYFIMCRTHVTDLDEWYSESTSLIVQQDGVIDDGDPPLTHFVNQTVAQSKDSHPFEFTASEAIEECRMLLPDRPLFTLTKQDNIKRTSEYEAILEDRKCSVTMFQVVLRWSGPIWVLYRGSDGMWKAFQPQILFVQGITDIPGNATMTLTETTATCSVPPGLPAARLRWTVDGKTVREDEGSVSNAWEWPWIPQTVQQRYKVESSDKDQRVGCHVYWPDFNTEVNSLEETIPGKSCLSWLVWVLTVVVVLLIVVLVMCYRKRTGLPLCWCACLGAPPTALTSRCSKKQQHIYFGIGPDEEKPAQENCAILI